MNSLWSGKARRTCVRTTVIAGLLLASAAVANPINLGNLVVTNSVSTQNLTGMMTGGFYNRVTFTTNWSHNSGTVTSMGAAFNFNAGSFTNVIASLSSISGFQNNANPTSLTAVCNLSVAVNSSTALTMIRAQNTGGFYHAANWSNTLLTFSYVPPIRPIPSGIREMGVRGNSNSAFRVVTGGGGSGGFSPAVGIYSDQGYLLASNVGAAGTPDNPDPGIDQLFMPEGTYYMFAAGAGTTFTTDDYVGTVPPGAEGGTISGSVGDGDWIDPTLGVGEGRWYSFSIVPAPGTTGLVVMGLVAAGRRRR
jgi:hypothetical protein